MINKRYLKTIFLLISGALFSIPAFCQFNPLTNSFSEIPGTKTVVEEQQDKPVVFRNTAGVTCNPNTFYAIGASGISEFTLLGTTISNNGVVDSAIGVDANLAFCNNLDGGSFSPTFYSSKGYTKIYYKNDTGWALSAVPSVAPGHLLNPGGNGNYLYFLYYDSNFISKGIARYNGSSISMVYSWDTSKAATVADLTVDNSGNVWFFTGAGSNLFFSDSLNEISPSGQLLGQYSLGYNTLNSYGSFMLNDTLYIGLGGSNPNHPNTLVPVFISGNMAIAGNPISFTGNYSDLASCTPGSPLSITENTYTPDFNFYPNPVTSELKICSSEKIEGLQIFDVPGREIYQYSPALPVFNLQLLTTNFKSGIYFIQLKTEKGIATKKFIMQH